MRSSPSVVHNIARILSHRYGDFHHYNKRNPLWELIFIICSVRTDEKKYLETYRSLRKEFPRLDLLVDASANDIAKSIAFGGLSRQKAFAMKRILSRIRQEFGVLSLSSLQRMTDDECESFLTSLPWVGRKVARCVMMFSLKRQVFPVDTHVWRICRRLGWIRRTRKDGTCSQEDMDRLQARIPVSVRYSLHVNMLSLGRDVCTSLSPSCNNCPIQRLCSRIGVKQNARES